MPFIIELLLSLKTDFLFFSSPTDASATLDSSQCTKCAKPSLIFYTFKSKQFCCLEISLDLYIFILQDSIFVLTSSRKPLSDPLINRLAGPPTTMKLCVHSLCCS